MSQKKPPLAIDADSAPLRAVSSNYPEPFKSRMAGRQKRPLGDLFGLTNFGVNLARLAPGASSSQMHRHTKQDEFVYILAGEPVLATDEGEVQLKAGMCAGFAAGGRAHHLINRSATEVLYLEIGDRAKGDGATYPNDDLVAVLLPDGKWGFTHKDGTPY